MIAHFQQRGKFKEHINRHPVKNIGQSDDSPQAKGTVISFRPCVDLRAEAIVDRQSSFIRGYRAEIMPQVIQLDDRAAPQRNPACQGINLVEPVLKTYSYRRS